LAFYAGVYGIHDRQRLEEVASLMGLEDNMNQRVSGLSTGWRQRLALATAIVHKPQLLFLDEPTSGVDPEARRAFWDLIYTLVEEGVSVLVTTHYMDEAEYCGRVGIMRDGRLLAMDTPTALKASALPGLAWDVFLPEPDGASAESSQEEGTLPLLRALKALQECPCVLRAGLVSDHLRAITPREITAQGLQDSLRQVGIEQVQLEQVEPTLEDVFLALAT
jgi:ABC-2 type transport system ATP-binding protein